MSSDPIKIGYITGVTGSNATPARNQALGVQLAVEEVNEQGGILGRPVVLITRDDKMDPLHAKKCAEGLIYDEKVDALIGTLSSSTVIAVNTEAVKAEKLFVSICQTNTITDHEHLGMYSFHEALTPHITAQMIGKWSIKNLGKRWVLMCYDFPFGYDCLEAYKEVIPRMGGEILAIIVVPLGATPEQYMTHFSKIVALKPDVLAFTSFGEDQVNFIKAAHRTSLVKEMSVVHTISDLFVVYHVPLDQLVGMYWSVNFYWQLEQTIPASRSFVERFRKRWGGELPSGYAGYGYSGVYEICSALEGALTSSTPENSVKFLEGRNYGHYKGRQWWRPCDHQSFQDIYMMRFNGPEESQYKYDIGEIIDTIKWDLDIERTCQHLGQEQFTGGHSQKK